VRKRIIEIQEGGSMSSGGQQGMQFYPIRGKVVPERKQQLFSYVDVVTQSVQTHLRRIGMRDVRQNEPNIVTFFGSSGTPFLKSDFGLEENIDRGMVRISTEGSTIAAYYYIRFLGRFAIRWFVPVGLITLLAFFEAGLRFLVLPFLAAALVIPLIATVFIIRWGIRKELKRAFEIAEEIIESGPGSSAISEVEAAIDLDDIKGYL
jgi:hypothetical protein